MTKFEAENLKVAFKVTKSVLDEFGFPNLYTVESGDVKTWFRTALSEFENAWASDEDNSIVLETNETMVRINYGATKLVIMSSEANNWVFKIPFKNCKCNYCQMEVDIYERACKENIEEFFAPCYFLENTIAQISTLWSARTSLIIVFIPICTGVFLMRDVLMKRQKIL